MNILTIKFNPTAVKTYDYLLINPKGLTLNSQQPLKIITSSNSWKEVFIINNTKMDVIPSWVTSKIILDANNHCTTERISCAKTIKPSSVITSVPKIKKPTIINHTQSQTLPPSLVEIFERQKRVREETTVLCRKILAHD